MPSESIGSDCGRPLWPLIGGQVQRFLEVLERLQVKNLEAVSWGNLIERLVNSY